MWTGWRSIEKELQISKFSYDIATNRFSSIFCFISASYLSSNVRSYFFMAVVVMNPITVLRIQNKHKKWILFRNIDKPTSPYHVITGHRWQLEGLEMSGIQFFWTLRTRSSGSLTPAAKTWFPYSSADAAAADAADKVAVYCGDMETERLQAPQVTRAGRAACNK